MKLALLSVAWNDDNWTFEALEAHYKTLVRYLNFKDMGMVLDAGLLDEVIVLIGAGIDGRALFPTVFQREDKG